MRERIDHWWYTASPALFHSLEVGVAGWEMKVPSLIVTDMGSWTLQSTGMDEGPGEEPRQGFTGSPAPPGGARAGNRRPCSRWRGREW